MFDLTKLNANLMKMTAIIILLVIFVSISLNFLEIQYKNIFQTALSSVFIIFTSFCLLNLAEVLQKEVIKKIGIITLILALLGVFAYVLAGFYFTSLMLVPRFILAASEILLFINLFLTGKHTGIVGFDLAAGLFILGIFIDFIVLVAYFILIMLFLRIDKKLEKINKVDKTLNITQSNCPVCGKRLGFSYLECSSCKRHFCYEHAKHEGSEVYCFECLGRMRRKL